MWETQDYFQMLTEHAIRGLMLLGTPDPYTVLAGDTDTRSPVARFFCCCFGAQDQLSGWEVGRLRGLSSGGVGGGLCLLRVPAKQARCAPFGLPACL